MTTSWFKIKKDKIRWYRTASDYDVLRCISDKPECGYAGLHQAIDKPFALREAKKRGLKYETNN